MQALREDYDDMRTDSKEMKADIRAIRETLQEARGGWKAMMLLGGGCMALGGAVVKFLPVVFR